MFERKLKIIFALAGIAIVVGFISGVAPGFYINNYGLFGIGLSFLLFLALILIITTLILQYQNKDPALPISSIFFDIFDKRLLRNEIILLIFTNALLVISGSFLGILVEMLLTALSATVAAHVAIAAIVIFALLVLFIIILVLEIKYKNIAQREVSEPKTILVEDISTSAESHPEPKIFPKAQNGPQNTATRVNPYHPRSYNDDSKSTWLTSSFNDSTSNNTKTKQPSTIQKEYQKLLYPPSHYFFDDKVFVNDKQVARIIGVEGMGIYQVQYLDTGLIDIKNGSELRKALPMIA